MKNFLFDLKIDTTLRIDAPDEAAARRFIDEKINGALVNAGCFANSEPVLVEIHLDGEAKLVEVDGEAV